MIVKDKIIYFASLDKGQTEYIVEAVCILSQNTTTTSHTDKHGGLKLGIVHMSMSAYSCG